MAKYIFSFFALFAVLGCIFAASSAYAQKFSVDKNTAIILFNIQHVGMYNNTDVEEGRITQPIEPYFKQIQFMKTEEPRTLTERVDRLIYGIRTDIPPEYDHYGYEIRRYMKSILTPEDLNNTLLLPEKIQNAKTARVIMDYWKKHLLDEISAIEKEIEATNAPSTTRTTFRYNSGIVHNFIPDAYLWIDKNIDFLEFLQENSGEYYVEYPYYDMSTSNRRKKMKELYELRESALEKLIVYSPFRAMVY